MRKSLQAHAVQPNIVETHRGLFQILVQILKFPNTKYIQHNAHDIKNTSIWWNSKALKKFWLYFTRKNNSLNKDLEQVDTEYKCDTVRRREIRPF